MNQKVMVAMSGGVDSSVAAYLLKQQGYNAAGVTLKLYTNDDIGDPQGHTCCSLEDVEDARSVAYALGMEHYVYNFSDDFRKQVMDRFVDSYLKGETPNPCIDCNRYIKFKMLYDRADLLDYDYISTGHYARIGYDSVSGRWLLKKGLDPSKDQSYVLYSMTQQQLSKTLFPVGELTKAQVREIADAHGFINSNKPDSQDICFVPDGDYKTFIQRYAHYQSREGIIIDLYGNVLGKHPGTIGYTIGQRRGLGVSAERPLYVVQKSLSDNTVTLGSETDLYSKRLTAQDINLIAVDKLNAPLKVNAKIRYSQNTAPAVIEPVGEGRAEVIFETPQRAVTIGQAVVFYDGDIVIGGGTISL